MFENEFYPTPEDLAARMVGMVDLAKVRTVLEPSAGKGDLLVQLKNGSKNHIIAMMRISMILIASSLTKICAGY